jgi:cob(I)alamin adenosyltransferase
VASSGSGDDGYTGLLGKGRVAKHDLIPETLGTLDEATASLGLARAFCQSEETSKLIVKVQRHLYSLMAEVAAEPRIADQFRVVDAAQVTWLEERIAEIEQKSPLPQGFILPGDTRAGAALDVARTVVRRAERRMAELFHSGWLQNPELLRYMNRLSSLVFALELYENQISGQAKPTLAKTEE